MTIPLTVDDPLAGQEIAIVVTVTAADRPLVARPILVSLGVTGQLPVIKTGVFADAPTLIDEAWNAFGVRAQVAGAIPTEPEIVAVDEELVATAAADEEAPALPKKPSAGNLSLF